jgi:hypothetical protein
MKMHFDVKSYVLRPLLMKKNPKVQGLLKKIHEK